MVVGVTNKYKTFLIAFSYCPSESYVVTTGTCGQVSQATDAKIRRDRKVRRTRDIPDRKDLCELCCHGVDSDRPSRDDVLRAWRGSGTCHRRAGPLPLSLFHSTSCNSIAVCCSA
jgi:hypothetical protein